MDGGFFTTEWPGDFMGSFDGLELGLELDDMFGRSVHSDIDGLRMIELEESPSWLITFPSSCSGTRIVKLLSDREIESPTFSRRTRRALDSRMSE